MKKQPGFGRLLGPINIGRMTVRNRIVMPAMGTGFTSHEGFITERSKDYYEARAKGGAGMIIFECACVDSTTGLHANARPVIDTDAALPGLSAIARIIKSHGAKAAIQLHHAGRMARFKVIGRQPLAPSPIPFPASALLAGEMPREATVEDIAMLVERFASAAVRAREAGFDGIEVHAAHHYLLSQFLSPFSNQRKDRYGGSIANRARALVEVLTAIRKAVGKDFPLWCRINGREEGIDNGLTLADAVAAAGLVNPLVDAISVAAFGYGTSPLTHMPDAPGKFLPYAAAVKKVVTVPVITAGRLSPELAENAIAEGNTDGVAIARGLLTEPDLANKLAAGRRQDVRPCIACYYCSDVGVIKNSPIACSVNASVGREKETAIVPATEVKKIAVIGGGPAGMEAARVLAVRGHKVTLFEKEARLGGQLVLAAVPPHKGERIEPLLSYYETQIMELKVDVRLNTEATVAKLRRLKPDAVILASGSRPAAPRLPGIESITAVTANDILSGRVEAGSRVVIIGGGSTGCETAEFLHEKGKTVTVVEMLPELAINLGYRDRLRLMLRLKAMPITFLTGTKCCEIQKDGVTVANNGDQQFIKADTLVLALGVKPDRTLQPVLEEAGFKTCLIGDCAQGVRIADAVADGLTIGCTL